MAPMESVRNRPRGRIVPAIDMGIVSIGVFVYLTSSPTGSATPTTITVALGVIALTIGTAVALVEFHDRAAICLASALVIFGGLGTAVGPQLWLISLLAGLALTIERSLVPLGILVAIAVLLGLTVRTATWQRSATALVATLVFASAAGTYLVIHRRVFTRRIG